ncbi:AAA family ATPase [Microtetraspora malaysiensis]|uniref:AAA family ATPase n=1 Tax=Microtetraspora malaysiensis TaxID=161358 RepID=UPI000A053953|nr:AAA family ATPase [Microtetraspora malaysiensis]
MVTIGYLDLLPGQRAVLDRLTEPGHHLVSGPPGSGKSLLAIHHAAALEIVGRPVTLIAHSKLLGQHLDADGVRLGASLPIMTFHGWVHAWYRETIGSPLGGTRIGSFDWPRLMSAALHDTGRRGHVLVIDEAQDLPQEFFGLCRVLGMDVIAFADEYQRITSTQSTLDEIEKALGGCGRLEISTNLRNPRPVAELACHFYPGLHQPPLPHRDGPVPVLLRRPEARRPFVRWLARYAENHRTLKIGVVVKRSREQGELLAEIERVRPGLRPQIYVGAAGDTRYQKVDPDRPGLRLVNRASVKGLEFDSVIVPDAHLDAGDPSSVDLKMLYYVLVTRTRGELYICYSGDQEPRMFGGIPQRTFVRQILPG